MGGGASKRDVNPAEEGKVDENDGPEESDTEEFYAESPEEAEEIRARMAIYEQKKKQRMVMRELSRKRKREAAGDDRAIKILHKQLSELICSRQMTTEVCPRFGICVSTTRFLSLELFAAALSSGRLGAMVVKIITKIAITCRTGSSIVTASR